MTLQGAISELNNLYKAEDIPFYYKPMIKKIIETVELSEVKTEINAKAKEHIKYSDCGRIEDGLYEALEIIDRKVNEVTGDKDA